MKKKASGKFITLGYISLEDHILITMRGLCLKNRFEENFKVSETEHQAEFGKLYKLISSTVPRKHIFRLSKVLLSINIYIE